MKQDLKVIDQLDLQNKRVFIRVDFNVPLEGGEVADATRIEEQVATRRMDGVVLVAQSGLQLSERHPYRLAAPPGMDHLAAKRELSLEPGTRFRGVL